jgi:hypothetical protein
MSYTVIGSYTPATGEAPAIIEREYFGQGYIFKDEEAFYGHPDKPCYVPELSDTAYTRQGLIELCGGREDFATECFQTVDWQHPETWVDEQFRHGEWDTCPKCGHWYDRHAEMLPCSKCGGPLEYEGGRARYDGIVEVTPDMLRRIIETREPLGLFYAREKRVYTGVDNHDGNAWTEPFPNLRSFKRWLLDQTKTAGGNE